MKSRAIFSLFVFTITLTSAVAAETTKTKVDEKVLARGRGPWGTTFPINLRLLVANMTEDQWLTLARNSKARPPMPVYILQGMEEADLKAIFQLIKHLGAAGSPAPDYVPPDQEPKVPFVSFPSPPPAP